MGVPTYAIILLAALLVSSCANESESKLKGKVLMDAENVESHDELLEFLAEKYGSVKELPVMALLSSGERKMVPHKYRLPDGREVSIDIVFTEQGKRILDPAYDLNRLPD